MINSYCPLPFRHVFIESRGIKPCCSFAEISSMSANQWLVSPRLHQLQQNITDGYIDPGCQDCITNELQSGTSTRLGALKDYSNDIFKETCIDYVDYRGSNICNFRCRSCEPYFSNRIAQDVRKSELLQTIYQIPTEKVVRADDPTWILDNLSRIRRLMFTGGEPTIMPGVREILSEVQRRDCDTQIILVTNGSFRDSYWLDMAKKMTNLNFTISIDAIGNAAEVIRNGTDWPIVESNIHYLAQNGHSLNFSTVVTNLNLFQLAPLLRFVNHIRRDYDRPNGRTQFIQLCNRPIFLNPINWPTDLQEKAIKYLESILVWEDYSPTKLILENLTETIKKHVYDREQWMLNERYNRELDLLRNELYTNLYKPTQ